jgi:hypothetical protein
MEDYYNDEITKEELELFQILKELGYSDKEIIEVSSLEEPSLDYKDYLMYMIGGLLVNGNKLKNEIKTKNSYTRNLNKVKKTLDIQKALIKLNVVLNKYPKFQNYDLDMLYLGVDEPYFIQNQDKIKLKDNPYFQHLDFVYGTYRYVLAEQCERVASSLNEKELLYITEQPIITSKCNYSIYSVERAIINNIDIFYNYRSDKELVKHFLINDILMGWEEGCINLDSENDFRKNKYIDNSLKTKRTFADIVVAKNKYSSYLKLVEDSNKRIEENNKSKEKVMMPNVKH